MDDESGDVLTRQVNEEVGGKSRQDNIRRHRLKLYKSRSRILLQSTCGECQATSLKLKRSLRSRIAWTSVKIGTFKASASSALHLQVQVRMNGEDM